MSVRGDAPEELAAAIQRAWASPARIAGGEVAIEAPRGHEVVPRIVELFAPGRLRSIATARPTLADVFAKLTGRGLDA